MTLHTSDECTITNNGQFSGKINTNNCYVNAPGQPWNAGCSIGVTDTTTYGDGLNSARGGVYAIQWNADQISVWHFPRGSIPSDITNGKQPNPANWGRSEARFSGNCDISQKFKNNQIARPPSIRLVYNVRLTSVYTGVQHRLLWRLGR